MFLCEKIQYLREKNGLSRKQLGKICGSSGTHIRYLEQGDRKDPQISTIIKIAQAFDLTVDELLKGTEFDIKKGSE